MKKQLLVLDDEPAIGDIVVDVAHGLGLDAMALQDGALINDDMMAAANIVVLDLMMPNMDGIEVIRRIAQSQRKPALLLMSGLERRTLDAARGVAAAKGLKVCGVIKKPFRPAELIAMLEQHLREDTAPQRKKEAPLLSSYNITTADVERGIRAGELLVHFQPQVMLADERWIGVEALVRWQHPVHGLLYPDAFVELAEGPELALPFTECVVRTAVNEFRTLSEATGFAGTLSVNMPPSALTDVAFPDKIFDILGQHHVHFDRFVLEVTETSIARDKDVSLDIEARLRMRGISLAVDDFGTGHSGLERLHEMPFDELKIDLKFVQHLDTDSAARAIVENAIRLGHGLQMRVVAEGVETAAIAAELMALGCDSAQGYFFARPLPSADLIRWHQARTAGHA